MSLSSSEQEARRQWPLFVIGAPRSGTTLLRYLLDSHENIACPPESKFIAALPELLAYPQVLPALRSLGLSSSEIHGGMRAVIEAVLGRYAASKGKPRWADKTPNYYRQLDFIDRVFEGQVLYCFIVRHPLDCVASLDAALPLYGIVDPDVGRAVKNYGRGLDGLAKFWVEVNERLLSFATANPERTHLLQYESLVEDATSTMRSLLHFMGEELPDGLAEKAFQQEHDNGYQDDLITQTKAVLQDRVGRWRAWPESQRKALSLLVEPLSLRLGYAPIAETR